MAYFEKLGLFSSGSVIAEAELEREQSPALEKSVVDRLVKHIKSGNFADFKKEAASAEKVDWNSATTGGWTCLHYAAHMGKLRIAAELLNTQYEADNR